MRYTPGRLGSDATNSFGSNVAKLHRATHHRPEHLRSQPARLGVIAAAVIGVDDVQAVDAMLGSMAEGKGAALLTQRHQYRVMGDTPQRQDHLHAGERRDLGGDVAVAAPDLGAVRLVL